MRDLNLLVKSFALLMLFFAAMIIPRGLWLTNMVESWVWFHDEIVITVMWRLLPVIAIMLIFTEWFRSKMSRYGVLLLLLIASVVQVVFGVLFDGISPTSDPNWTSFLIKLFATIAVLIGFWWWLPGDKSSDFLARIPNWFNLQIVVMSILTGLAGLGQAAGGCVWYLPVMEQTGYVWGRFGRDLIENEILLISMYTLFSSCFFALAFFYYKRYIAPKLTS